MKFRSLFCVLLIFLFCASVVSAEADLELKVEDVTENSVTLVWNSLGDDVKYIIERDNKPIATTRNTYYEDTKLTPNTKYLYSVEAVLDERQYKDYEVVTTSEIVLSKPDVFKVTFISDEEIHLMWDDKDYNSFKLYRDGRQIYSGSRMEFEDRSLRENTNYNYSLVGVTSYGESEQYDLSIRTLSPYSVEQIDILDAYYVDKRIFIKFGTIDRAHKYRVKGNSEYEIYRASNSSSTYNYIKRNNSDSGVSGRFIGDRNYIIFEDDYPRVGYNTSYKIHALSVDSDVTKVVGTLDINLRVNRDEQVEVSSNRGNHKETFPSLDERNKKKDEDKKDDKKEDPKDNSNKIDGTKEDNVNKAAYDFAMSMAEGRVMGCRKYNEDLEFSDITNHPLKDFIKEGARIGLSSGYPDGTFNPDGHLTRAEFATFIEKSLCLSGITQNPFDDLNHDKWFYKAALTSYDRGYIVGYSDNIFGPNDIIPIKQANIIMKRVADDLGVDVTNLLVTRDESQNITRAETLKIFVELVNLKRDLIFEEIYNQLTK